MQALWRTTGLFGRRFDLSYVAQLAAEEAVPSGKTVAEEAGSGKAAGFAGGIQCTVAVVAKLGSFAAVRDLNIPCIEIGADLHQSQ